MANLKETYWPEIVNEQVARKCIKFAVGVAYAVAVVTGILALLDWMNIVHIVSTSSLFDAVIFAALGVFIGRGSATAAVLALLFYLFEVGNRIASGGGSGGGVIVMLIFTLGLLNGVRGALALKRLASQHTTAAQSNAV